MQGLDQMMPEVPSNLVILYWKLLVKLAKMDIAGIQSWESE